MTSVDPIREALIAKPFRPFELRLVGGRSHVVNHPDWLTVPPARRPRIIIYWEPQHDEVEEYRCRWIDLSLIVELVVPAESSAPPLNGPRVGA